MKKYYVYVEDNELEISEHPPSSNPLPCKRLFENLSEYLKSNGYELVYFSGRSHREEVYRKDGEIIILIYDFCLIRTNLAQTVVTTLIRNCLSRLSFSGVI